MIKAKRKAQGAYPKASPLPLGAVVPHQLVVLLDPPVAVDRHRLLVPSLLGGLGYLVLRLRGGGGGRRGHQPYHDCLDTVVAAGEQWPRGRRRRDRRCGEETGAGAAEEDGSGPGAHHRS